MGLESNNITLREYIEPLQIYMARRNCFAGSLPEACLILFKYFIHSGNIWEKPNLEVGTGGGTNTISTSLRRQLGESVAGFTDSFGSTQTGAAGSWAAVWKAYLAYVEVKQASIKVCGL